MSEAAAAAAGYGGHPGHPPAAATAKRPKASSRAPVLRDTSKKLCAFCGADESAYGGNLGRMQGPFYTSSKGHDAVYVHHECALWSPQITVDVWNRLQSVVREVRRARNLRCSVCDKPGAALGCRVPSCSRCFHLPCAIEHGCWFNFELYLMSCHEHSALFKKEPAGRQREGNRAVAGPLKHLKLSSRHLLSGLPKVFAGHEAAAAAAAVLGNSSAGAGRRARAASGGKRRNAMSAEELGSHMAAAEEAYLKLVDDLRRGEESEDDEAVFAHKNAKRFRKAEQLLAPTLLQPAPMQRPRTQQQQHPEEGVQPASTAQQLLPPDAEQRYLQHMQQGSQQPVGQQQALQPAAMRPAGAAGQHQPSAAGFKGVGGLDDAKRQLREMVLMPLTYPDLYRNLGMHPPRGILLHGPPGTGKTALVRALAAECAAAAALPDSSSGSNGNGVLGAAKPVALFARKGTDCLGKYAGDAELHLRMLFEMAAASAPSIIFLDELDGLVPARSTRSGGSDQIFASIVSVLLALMDGLTDRGQVLVIGATNRPDNIDPALRRPGRFDREVFVGLPAAQHRADILALHTAQWTPAPTRQQLELMAAQTEGWAGADLQALAASALIAAVRRVTPQVLDSLAAQQEQQQQQQQQHGVLLKPHSQQQQQPAAETCCSDVGGEAAPDGPAAAATAAAAGCVAGVDPVQPAGSQAAGPSQQHPPAAAMDTSPPPAAQQAAEAAAEAAAAAEADGVAGGSGGGGGGFLAALQEVLGAKPRTSGFLFSPARLESKPQLPQQQPERSVDAVPSHPQVPEQPQHASQQQLCDGAGVQQQQGPEGQLHPQPLQQQHQHQQPEQAEFTVLSHPEPPEQQQQRQQQPEQACVPPPPPPSLPPSVPRPRGSKSPPPPATALPAAMASLQVLACDWAAALSELGPPASKRGTHNLPALSPAAALPAPLLPLLLPGLTRVVGALQDWLWLGPQEQQQWQAALLASGPAGGPGEQAAAGGSSMASLAAAAGAMGYSGGGAAGPGGGAVAELLTAWGVVEALPGGSSSSSGGQQGTTAVGGTGGLLGGSSSLMGAAAVQQLGGGSNNSGRLCCLLLSGHGPEGQAELAAATLKLLDSKAGTAVYSLSLPVMLLLGEGAAGAGLVAGVQEALSRNSSSSQPLVIYMPRLELWALEASKPSKTAAVAKASGASHQQHRPQQALGGWASGLTSAFGCDSSDSSSDASDADSDDADMQQQEAANNTMSTSAGPAAGAVGSAGVLLQQPRPHQPQQRVAPHCQPAGVSLSAAWSVFEQQLAMLASQRRLLVLATSQLPVGELPVEVQQVFGWQPQQTQHPSAQQQQQQQSPRGLALSCSSSRTVQVCDWGDGQAHEAAAARAALAAALERAVTAAAAVLGDSPTDGADQPPLAPPIMQQQQPRSSSRSDECSIQHDSAGSAGDGVDHAPEAPRQQQQQQRSPVDALIDAAVQHKEQQREQGQALSGAAGQQVLAAQQLGAALQQLNDAQKAEAQTLLSQVQASLQHIASTVLHDPRLSLTRTHRQQGSRAAAAAGAPVAAALQELQACAPLAAVCVKALRGWYSGLDAFQEDFSAAAAAAAAASGASAASRSQRAGTGADGHHSSASAAAATLQDVVCCACHEARLRLRLYDLSRQQLLEAAALAKQGELQMQQAQAEQQRRQRRQEGVFKVPRPRPRPAVPGGGEAAVQQTVAEQSVRQHGVAAGPAGAAGFGPESVAPARLAVANLELKLRSQADAVLAATFGANGGGCPWAAAFSGLQTFGRTLASLS